MIEMDRKNERLIFDFPKSPMILRRCKSNVSLRKQRRDLQHLNEIYNNKYMMLFQLLQLLQESMIGYLNNCRTIWLVALAWATEAIPDCIKILFLVKLENSEAMFVSIIEDSAARTFWL